MTPLLRCLDASGFPSISSSWRRLPAPSTLLPVGWVAFHPWHRCHPGPIAVSLEEIPVSLSFLDLTSSSLLAYSFVSVEYILQSSLRKDMWDGFLETLHIWKCLILDWLISLGIEFQVGNYFPPETLSVFSYCLLASRMAVKRRKLFSFLILSNWKLRESSFSSQSSDISWQCALAGVYFYLLCWTLCESWKSRKLFFTSVIFSKSILLMISHTLTFFFSFWDYNYLKMEHLDKSSGFSFFFSPIVPICHLGRINLIFQVCFLISAIIFLVFKSFFTLCWVFFFNENPILISPVHALCYLLDDIKTGFFFSFFFSLFSVIFKLVLFVWFIFIFQVWSILLMCGKPQLSVHI